MADPERPTFEFIGRFLAKSEDQHARSRATSLQETRAFNTAAPTVTTMKANLPFVIRDIDQLTRLETDDVFTVTKVKDGDFDRIVLILRSGAR